MWCLLLPAQSTSESGITLHLLQPWPRNRPNRRKHLGTLGVFGSPKILTLSKIRNLSTGPIILLSTTRLLHPQGPTIKAGPSMFSVLPKPSISVAASTSSTAATEHLWQLARLLLFPSPRTLSSSSHQGLHVWWSHRSWAPILIWVPIR